jgi:glycosyltransferase involved in cell wall biosynthesis
MLALPEALVASPIPGLVPLDDRRQPLKVLIASLAHGGAERIVLEWLAEEAKRGRAIELAILHPRSAGWKPARGITAIARGRETPAEFVASLAQRWRGAEAPVAAHLIGDDLLEILWRAGIATIPTVHNAREGWRNDPAHWREDHVPLAIACAQSVRTEMREAGCRVPTVAIRHVPASPRGAVDAGQRQRIRAQWNVAESTLLVGTVGAFKPQKDFPRAVEILAALRAHRDAELVILGGVLDDRQLAELDLTLERVASLGLGGARQAAGIRRCDRPYYAACDVLLQASRFEGLSMAAREALACGLPVVAMDVGGQSEIVHERLELLPPRAGAEEVARSLRRHAPRTTLRAEPPVRAPRIWSLAHARRASGDEKIDTLFVTANLNAGGAQRSLVNLASALPSTHRTEVAVCGETTQPLFAQALADAGIRCYRPAPSADPFAVAESLLARASGSRARTVCFWNTDPRVKLLVAKFAPASLRLVDASPGAYAFAELEAEAPFARAVTFSAGEYYERLDVLVLKHDAREHRGRSVRVIRNGVRLRRPDFRPCAHPRFLVSGRIVPSKHLETILESFVRFAAGHDGARLHVVGQAEPRHAPYLARLMDLARGHPIRFRGPGAGLEHLDEPFSAAIVLGTHQGCPNAVLEAMASSIPVIANASGGTGELVRPQETGWLLDESPGPGDLVEAMAHCASDAANAARVAARAYDHVARHFSIEAMSEAYLECFAGEACERG